MTLVELLVAMGIFLVVTSVFLSGVVSMTRTTARAEGVSDATSVARKVLNRFDKQVRYSSAINRPGTGALGSYYVELLVPSKTAGAAPVCVQWRYDPPAHTLALRSWTDAPVPLPSAWSVWANDVRNELSPAAPAVAEPPFVFTAANSGSLRQKLTITLDIGVRSHPGVVTSTTYVALNTTSDTRTNLDIDGNKQSDSPVCLAGVGRP